MKRQLETMINRSRYLTQAVHSRRILFAGILVSIAFFSLLSGCCSAPRLAYRTQYFAPEGPMPFKRADRFEEVDYLHRWRSKAFYKLKPDPDSVSADQAATLEKYGSPDFVRNFHSRDREEVTEWVYEKKNAVVQFVCEDMAYTGPMTDKEKMLIYRGYPDKIMRYTSAKGADREDFIYWNWLHTSVQVYSFANGYLVEMQE